MRFDIAGVLSDNEQLINPSGDVEVAFDVDIKAGMRAGSDESDFDEKVVDLEIPNPGCLFETVKGVQQTTDYVLLHSESFWLRHINSSSNLPSKSAAIPCISHFSSAASAKIDMSSTWREVCMSRNSQLRRLERIP
jgi:hypothetical protein